MATEQIERSKKMKMIYDTFYVMEESGEEEVERKCRILEAEGWQIVSKEHGMIKQSGSDIPTAKNYGMLEPGWIIKVMRPHLEERSRYSNKHRPARWLWED